MYIIICMCLGETRNNQGDSFVYDGKISKSKRKLLEGGINVFTSSFLRAKHIQKMKILRFLIPAMILLSIVTSVQAATISGSSTIEHLGECENALSITFTSDDPNSRLTKAVIDRSSIGGTFGGIGPCFGWFGGYPPTPSDPAFTATFSGWGTDELTIDFTGFKPGMIFGVNIDELGTLYWAGSTIAVTVTGSECTFTGTYAEVDDFEYTANFGGTCPPIGEKGNCCACPAGSNPGDPCECTQAADQSECVDILKGTWVGANNCDQGTTTGCEGLYCQDGSCIPEFSTIAIPVASILGLLFFFNYRKRKREQ